MSHEFQVLADSGEDLILSCTKCDYAANLEKARKKIVVAQDTSEMMELKEVLTPDKKAVEDVAAFLSKPVENFIKSMLFIVDTEPVLVLVPGDREVNEAKIQAFFQADSVALADDATVMEVTGADTGFAGPVGLKKDVKIAIDNLLVGRRNLVCGANKTDFHFDNVSPERDFKVTVKGDFIVVRAGESCPDCDGVLEECRGIEVGQVFFLGTKYSEKMKCTFVDENGKNTPAVMGCYGIGVGRTVQAAIEQNHDEYGIKWPMALAPYEVVVLPLQMNKEVVVEAAEEMYTKLLEAGLETAIDDRNERAGFKFNDADLVGYPIQVIFGAKSLDNGVAEIKIRKTGEKVNIKLDEVVDFVKNYKEQELKVD